MKKELTSNEQIKLAVMARDISYIKAGVDKLEENQEAQLNLIKSEYAKKVDVENLEIRVKSFEDLRGWSGRIILGALLMGVLALLGLNVGR
jgi:hypothetical protein|tara:strand:+ start:11862 stop:12134 length:273 start_codon:yes stop_codon:yes gene_type:complete